MQLRPVVVDGIAREDVICTLSSCGAPLPALSVATAIDFRAKVGGRSAREFRCWLIYLNTKPSRDAH